jgi:hypothetical protein
MPAKSAGKKPRENEHDIGLARAAICPALPALSSSGAASSPASGYAGAGSPNTSLIAIAARPAFGQAAARCRAEPRRRGEAGDALAVPVVPGRAQQELRLPGYSRPLLARSVIACEPGAGLGWLQARGTWGAGADRPGLAVRRGRRAGPAAGCGRGPGRRGLVLGMPACALVSGRGRPGRGRRSARSRPTAGEPAGTGRASLITSCWTAPARPRWTGTPWSVGRSSRRRCSGPADPDRPSGHRRDRPASRGPGQDRGSGRPRQRRAAHARGRGRLAGERACRVRHRAGHGPGADGPVRRSGPHLALAARSAPHYVPGPLLPAAAGTGPARPGPGAAAAAGRRRRRAAHAAHRGPVRRSVESRTTPAVLAHKVSVPHGHSRQAGRDPGEIHVSAQALPYLSAGNEGLRGKTAGRPPRPVIAGTPGEVTAIIAGTSTPALTSSSSRTPPPSPWHAKNTPATCSRSKPRPPSADIRRTSPQPARPDQPAHLTSPIRAPPLTRHQATAAMQIGGPLNATANTATSTSVSKAARRALARRGSVTFGDLSASEPGGREWMPSCLVAARRRRQGSSRAARGPVPPRRVRWPLPPKRRRSVPIASEDRLVRG